MLSLLPPPWLTENTDSWTAVTPNPFLYIRPKMGPYGEPVFDKLRLAHHLFCRELSVSEGRNERTDGRTKERMSGGANEWVSKAPEAGREQEHPATSSFSGHVGQAARERVRHAPLLAQAKLASDVFFVKLTTCSSSEGVPYHSQYMQTTNSFNQCKSSTNIHEPLRA